ncbi:Enoyl-CoA hydratase/isomerase family [Musa troglodytarum]|uniref:Enoyl-CoA hydratase/isomerase family n=1 Tax=Musa troglodytarum TaxID=320322 RepID=A0A9E7ELV5_9LILI|nr:Enoyl-CoA hydratase/isomerase family [Musa troglodytarum]
MMVLLAAAIRRLDADPAVGALVLTGRGRAFCSGVDLTAAEEVFKGDVKDVDANPVAQMERCRKPIIGAVNGFAVTAGFEIALACDILVAGKDAKFIDTTPEMAEKWGLNHVVDNVINDGFKLDLGHALALEKDRATCVCGSCNGKSWNLFERMLMHLQTSQEQS